MCRNFKPNKAKTKSKQKHQAKASKNKQQIKKQKASEVSARPFREACLGGTMANKANAKSGWEEFGIVVSYIDIVKYEPFAGNSYIPLPKDLAARKAIINV